MDYVDTGTDEVEARFVKRFYKIVHLLSISSDELWINNSWIIQSD